MRFNGTAAAVDGLAGGATAIDWAPTSCTPSADKPEILNAAMKALAYIMVLRCLSRSLNAVRRQPAQYCQGFVAGCAALTLPDVAPGATGAPAGEGIGAGADGRPGIGAGAEGRPGVVVTAGGCAGIGAGAGAAGAAGAGTTGAGVAGATITPG